MLRFRGYREAESPEPLDLLIVSHFDGMAGMDASNRALRQISAAGRPVFAWYGALSEIAQSHRDEFAEMLPELGDSAAVAGDSSAGLVVIERVRVLPTERSSYERLVRARVRAVERARSLVRWSETGRFLVSDGWDYVRFIGISSLADWQRYRSGDGGRGGVGRNRPTRRRPADDDRPPGADALGALSATCLPRPSP